jgi:plasmid stabilization system protein ParE
MDYTIKYSEQAEMDLDGLSNYIIYILKNAKAANDLLKEFHEKLLNLTGTPRLYAYSRVKKAASMGLRCFTFGNYIAYYYVNDIDLTVVIARIFYQRQDYENAF